VVLDKKQKKEKSYSLFFSNKNMNHKHFYAAGFTGLTLLTVTGLLAQFWMLERCCSQTGKTGRMIRLGESRTVNKRLVVYNALGKRNNLVLVEDSRRNIFQSSKGWDCIAFMFALEETIPDNDMHLKNLRDELKCTILRRPGFHWGDYLQLLAPPFVSSYDYLALVLDDMFIPHQGENAVDADVLIQRMQTHDIDVISPGVVEDTHNFIGMAESKKYNLKGCLAEVSMIETYVQIFSSDAWDCYYSMLHYSGSVGWCYDNCFKEKCPNLKLAFDFSMKAWHMDKSITKLPKELIDGTKLKMKDWTPEPPITSLGYREMDAYAICHREGNCPSVGDQISKGMTKINCQPET